LLLPRFISGLVALLCVGESLDKAFACARDKCDKAARPYLIGCTAERYIDPDGNEHPL